jgi:hypothetical protein
VTISGGGPAWPFGCTFKGCHARSPAAKTAEGMRGVAVRAKWRVWGRRDPELRDGEALCPTHKAHPVGKGGTP